MKRNLLQTATQLFHNAALVPLMKYITIDNCTPGSSDYHKNDKTEDAVSLMLEWMKARPIPGLTTEIKRHPDASSPLIYTNIPATPGYEDLAPTLLYCHGDKQPPSTGWDEGFGAYTPVQVGDKLYGRGGADDGYGIFASALVFETLIAHGIPYGRCVILTEFSEESGSPDLPLYLELLKEELGDVALSVCLDSGAGDYDRLWATTNLRGVVNGVLRVEVLTQEVHSGGFGGIVASPFDVATVVLNRLREPETGRVLLPALQAHVPQNRRAESEQMFSLLGERALGDVPLAPGARILGTPQEALLRSRWESCIAVIGQRGLGDIDGANNVIIPVWELKLSIRLPPTVNSAMATQAIRDVIETMDCPARVTFTPIMDASGWHATEIADWLRVSLNSASTEHFGSPMMEMGEGGTIPFMGMLQKAYPESELLVTGLLGPGSNAHGPNESLDIPTVCKIIAVLADVLSDRIALSQ